MTLRFSADRPFQAAGSATQSVRMPSHRLVRGTVSPA